MNAVLTVINTARMVTGALIHLTGILIFFKRDKTGMIGQSPDVQSGHIYMKIKLHSVTPC